jgi:4-carboxymuconolactone decarboxylase
MSRLPQLRREALDPAAQAVWDRIASGARGGVGGPFTALILSPELCSRVEQLGVFIRYECSVPMRLRELAILCVGQHWQADYEWFAHAPIAATQGVPAAVIAAGGESIPFDAPADAVVVGFVRALLRTGRVPDAEFAAAQALLGQKATVELTGLVGYYSLLAMQLNTFEVAPPPTVPIPWR